MTVSILSCFPTQFAGLRRIAEQALRERRITMSQNEENMTKIPENISKSKQIISQTEEKA